MKKIMSWLGDSFAPKMDKVISNPWIASISDALMKALPFILVGSLGYFYNVFSSFIPGLPDIGNLINFSFGFLAIFVAFLVSYQIMEKKKYNKYQVPCGLLAIATYMMALHPVIDESYMMSINYSYFGPTGLLVAMIIGLYVGFVYNAWAKLNLFKDSTTIPDFIGDWINNMAPITITLVITMVLVYNFNVDIAAIITKLFSPIASFGQTYPGFVLCCFIPAFFYSLGISSWALGSITTPIYLAGIVGNIEAVANGLPATNITTSETVFTAALITLGGMGATLPLVVHMMRSKSKKLSLMGKICIGPSIFNINEPVIYGAPVVLNPLLMVPMWLNAIVGPTIVYFSMRSGLLNIPSKMINIGQIPAPFASVMITEDMRAVIFWVLLFAVYYMIWMPFFKTYEKTVLAEESAQKN